MANIQLNETSKIYGFDGQKVVFSRNWTTQSWM